MTPNPWVYAAGRLFALLLTALVLGLFFGHTLLLICASLIGYLAWHLVNLYRLDHWLRHTKKLDPPDAPGLWGEVFYQIYRLQRRNRKRKHKLTNMLKRFKMSTGAMPDATVVLDAGYHIEWINKAASQLLGLQTPQDIGQHIGNLLRYPALVDYLQRSNGNRESIKITAPGNPQRVLRIHLVPYAGNMRLLIARDITELQRLEQIRQDFVANVSHELRTPLTVIAGFIETMQDAAESDDPCARQWQRPLTLMAQQTTRMHNIVQDLLLLSRLESEVPMDMRKPVAVAEMLAALREDAEALSGDQNHQIQLEADHQLQIYGEAAELNSAFSNLAFNAVRYTPASGQITMRWYQDEEGAHFAVEDTGEGIAEHHLPRLTERFYRVDVGRSRSQGGTGLGLAIAKHVLSRHGARLHISSQLGKGSVFRCDFPPSCIVTQAAPAPV